MHVKDLPVVILAAGMSKRFNEEHRTTHKSLLTIDNDVHIFDFVLNGLVQNGVSRVKILLGYKSKEFMQFLDKKKTLYAKNLHLHPIISNPDYVKGPIYTLLSIFSELDNSIRHFIVIPSDTIFHPTILKQIFSCELKQSLNQIYLFSVGLSDISISQMNQKLSFSPHIVGKSLISNVKLKNYTPFCNKFYYIPILILSRSFLEFVHNPENRISGKIIQNVENFCKDTGDCHVFRLHYDLEIPPFLDIDTSHTYNTLNRVKKEFLEPYKVK